jgi:hypothetical protein
MVKVGDRKMDKMQVPHDIVLTTEAEIDKVFGQPELINDFEDIKVGYYDEQYEVGAFRDFGILDPLTLETMSIDLNMYDIPREKIGKADGQAKFSVLETILFDFNYSCLDADLENYDYFIDMYFYDYSALSIKDIKTNETITSRDLADKIALARMTRTENNETANMPVLIANMEKAVIFYELDLDAVIIAFLKSFKDEGIDEKPM